jgi:hypothetical protein
MRLFIFLIGALLIFLDRTARPIVANYFWPCEPVRFVACTADFGVAKSSDAERRASVKATSITASDRWTKPPSMAITMKNVSKIDR